MRMTSLVAAVSVVALAACAKSKEYTDSASGMADTTAATTTLAPAPVAIPLTDANIGALLDEANAGDSAAGKLASTKGTKADVKAFGVLMMRDHHALRVLGIDLVKKLNITPTPPANDSLPGKGKAAQDNLNSMERGPAWDRTYIDGEVATHLMVLRLIDNAQTTVTAPELKDLLTKARPAIEMHLKRAQDIQAKLAADSTKKN